MVERKMGNTVGLIGAVAVIGVTVLVMLLMRSRSSSGIDSFLEEKGFARSTKCPVDDPFGVPSLKVKTDNLTCWDGKLSDGQAVTLMFGATVGAYAGQYVGVYLPPGSSRQIDLARYQHPNRASKTPDGGTLVVWWKRMYVDKDDVDAHLKEIEQAR
jgi:hypothetical protein